MYSCLADNGVRCIRRARAGFPAIVYLLVTPESCLPAPGRWRVRSGNSHKTLLFGSSSDMCVTVPCGGSLSDCTRSCHRLPSLSLRYLDDVVMILSGIVTVTFILLRGVQTWRWKPPNCFQTPRRSRSFTPTSDAREIAAFRKFLVLRLYNVLLCPRRALSLLWRR